MRFVRIRTATHFTARSIQFIKIAKESKAICDKYKIPLIINDRVDVALAVGCEGVHIGQDDIGG